MSCCAHHKNPCIKKIDFPKGASREALVMKELKLPYAEQTHEVCYEPVTKKIFVTQMTNSTLVRFGVDKKGMLEDCHEAWTVGPETGGLHNASLSFKYPGCLWLSLQYMNVLMLIDVRPENFLEVKQIYQVPSTMHDPKTGNIAYVGGPHCMRECPVTGHLWAGLKGALDKRETNPCGKISACCDPDKLKENMEEHGKLDDHDIKLPNSYGVWQLDPSKYDPKAADGQKGGKLYPCLNSPPMISIDYSGNAWIPQDQSPTIQYIDAKKQVSEQLPVPWPKNCPDNAKHSGPGLSKSPDGSIWMVQLECFSSLVRINPDTMERILYEIETPAWAKGMHLIHLAFPPKPKEGEPKKRNRIYAIATTLLEDDSSDALLIMNMCDDWLTCEGIRIIPLPSQGSACHRIAYCEDMDDDDETDDGSVFITELTKSKLLQVKVSNDVYMTKLKETIVSINGFTHHKYRMTDKQFFERDPFLRVE